jgi:hypothetical protein
VRRHAKAPTAGSTRHNATAAFAVLIALGVFLFAAAPAFAATVTDRPLLFTFKGSEATGTAIETARTLAIDNQTGRLFVANDFTSNFLNEKGKILSFDANGAPAGFSALGTPYLCCFTNQLGVAVDNTGGASQGRLLVSQFGDTRMKAFEPSGSPLWTQLETFGQIVDVAADASGHPWTSNGNEYANTGSPPERIFSLGESGHRIDVDANGNVYLVSGSVQKYAGGVFDSTLDPSAKDVYADQSSPTGHIFTVESGAFTEFAANGTELGTFGAGYVGSGESIAYNPALDRVYVLQDSAAHPGSNLVAVFGATQTGTVADNTIEAPSAIGISSAHFAGTVNPQGTSSEWHFEWKRAGEAWDAAESSPPVSLPADSSPHAVEFTTDSLRGNTAYEVRLAAVNTANGLAGFSSAESFTTAQAATAPAVTIADPSAVTASTAAISGTVNPQGDTADWRVQLSTDPACASGFADQPLRTISPGSAVPVGVSFELTGLLASEHYCARIAATNSAGTTESEVKEFTTQPIAPDQVETIAPAPRLDTSARLNARVNPEGEELTYHFEWSEDGGTTWHSLAEHTGTSESRTQEVIADELTGLQPNTPYSYRVVVESPAGQVQSQALSFTTRSIAEMTLPQRGDELVNTPNKGNQNVFSLGVSNMEESPLSEDGEKALWYLRGGSSGAFNGTGAVFLAERSTSGWHSRSVPPPAEQQAGGGDLTYQMMARTPDMSRFVFAAARSVLFGTAPDATFLSLDSHQNQTQLHTYEGHYLTSGGISAFVDVTDDGSHVLLVDPAEQLVDIGSGTPEVISIMPEGNQAECGVPASILAPGSYLFNWRSGYHSAATTDASLVYFVTKPNGGCSALEGLYMRDRQAGETTLIDPGANGRSVEFIRATPDGQHAYFVTNSALDPADANTTADVYRWDEASGESSCLTCVVAEAAVGEAVPVLNGIGQRQRTMVSGDFSHIYFVSGKQLVPGRGFEGVAGLYELSDGELNLVATVPVDVDTLNSVRVRLSADGNVLTFKDHGSLRPTADSIAPECEGVREGLSSRCEELYRYEASDESLECLSCARGGITTHDVGSPSIGDAGDFQLSSDGRTVAFATKETLLPEDINQTTDVYEWRNGALQLITDGVTEFQQGFAAPQVVGVSANGRDILFSVDDPGLTGFEQDGFSNLYDARIGGGFERPISPTHCSEETCQAPPQAAPGGASPGSATFGGHGNLPGASKARKCAKGKVRRRGRCVRRHKARHRRASHGNRGRAK